MQFVQSALRDLLGSTGAELYAVSARRRDGLPLLRAGDWNDGIDALGRRNIGTSVWMGFFLFNVLDGFIPLARMKGDETFAARCFNE